MSVKSAKFWDKLANRYSRKPISDTKAYELKLNKIREFLSPKARVLELGCGTGTTALALAPNLGHIVASDYSKGMLDIAQAKAEATSINNISFKQAPAEQVLADSEQYDMVMAHSVLHLVEQPELLTQQIFNTVKPGGYFVQNTPCLSDHKAFLKLLLPPLSWIGLVPKIGFFRQAEITKQLQALGFVVEYQWFHKKADSVFVIARKPRS